VIHILNVELEKHGEDAVGLLIPRSFLGNPYEEVSRPYSFEDEIPF
jgi:hypothetical protein